MEANQRPVSEFDYVTYYDVLDVKPDASPAEIRHAYTRAKLAYGKSSPALYSLFDEQQTKDAIDHIEQAYLVLSNPEKRKEYDRLHGFVKSAEDPKGPNATFSFSNFSTEVNEEPAPAATPSRELVEPERAALQRLSTMTLKSVPAAAVVIKKHDIIKPTPVDQGIEEQIAAEIDFRGEFLKKIREYRSVSLDELSDFTKISKTYLQCIEAEAFESLPAPVYLRGFLIQIAKALKLNPDKVAKGYMTYYKNTYLK
ncbi:MAG: helix-turn-helix domain-containing protein [Bacteriovoracia bacterium]